MSELPRPSSMNQNRPDSGFAWRTGGGNPKKNLLMKKQQQQLARAQTSPGRPRVTGSSLSMRRGGNLGRFQPRITRDTSMMSRQSQVSTAVANQDTEIDECNEAQLKVSMSIDKLRRKMEKLKETISALEIDIREEDRIKDVPRETLIANEKKKRMLENALLRTRQERSAREGQLARLKREVDEQRLDKQAKLGTQGRWARDLEAARARLAEVRAGTAAVQSRIGDVRREATEAKQRAAEVLALEQEEEQAAGSALRLTASVTGLGGGGGSLVGGGSPGGGQLFPLRAQRSTAELDATLGAAREALDPRAPTNHPARLAERVAHRRGTQALYAAKSSQIIAAEGVLQAQAARIEALRRQVEEIFRRASSAEEPVAGAAEFVEGMNRHEERHFALFNCINDLKAEEEHLLMERHSLEHQMKAKCFARWRLKKEQDKKFRQLTSQLNGFKKGMKYHTASYEQEAAQLRAVAEPLAKILNALFPTTEGKDLGGATLQSTPVTRGLAPAELLELGAKVKLLQTTGLTETNTLDVAALIEQGIDRNLQLQSLVTKEDFGQLVERLKAAPPAPAPPSPVEDRAFRASSTMGSRHPSSRGPSRAGGGGGAGSPRPGHHRRIAAQHPTGGFALRRPVPPSAQAAAALVASIPELQQGSVEAWGEEGGGDAEGVNPFLSDSRPINASLMKLQLTNSERHIAGIKGDRRPHSDHKRGSGGGGRVNIRGVIGIMTNHDEGGIFASSKKLATSPRALFA